jgi:hypothetical protein
VSFEHVYFDLDGTLAGDTNWKGFFRNTIGLFTNLLYRPDCSIWSIITGRPKIDYPIIKSFCIFHQLKPMEIITLDNLFYPFNDNHEHQVASWKKKILMKKMDNQPTIKIIYVDNDHNVLQSMSSSIESYTIKSYLCRRLGYG